MTAIGRTNQGQLFKPNNQQNSQIPSQQTGASVPQLRTLSQDTVEFSSKPEAPQQETINLMDVIKQKAGAVVSRFRNEQSTNQQPQQTQTSSNETGAVPRPVQRTVSNTQTTSTGTAGDGRITSYKQGLTADCWLLSSINAVANDPQGQQILNETISRTDGGYNVNFRGAPGQTYFVSEQQLAEAKEWEYTDRENNLGGTRKSTGDDDVTILEIAAEQHFGEIDYDYASRGVDLLTGKEAESTSVRGRSINHEYVEEFQNLPEQQRREAYQNIRMTQNSGQYNREITAAQQQIKAESARVREEYNQLLERRNELAQQNIQQRERFNNAETVQEQQRMGGLEQVQAQINRRKEQIRQYDQQLNQLDARLDNLDSQMATQNARRRQVNNAVEWSNNNSEVYQAVTARQEAVEILNQARTENDHITMTASRLLDLNDSGSGHVFSVKIEQGTGDILVTNPHDTSQPPERYTSDDAFLSMYRGLTYTNDL